MKRILLLWAVLSGSSLLHADPALPDRWQALGNAVVTGTGDGMTIQSPGRGGGISGVIKNVAGQRCVISFEARGQGAIRCFLRGSSGWAYSPNLPLSDEWQTFSNSYFCTQKSITCKIYSPTDSATDFAIRNIRITVPEMPEMSDEEIAPRRFLPAEYPGPNGKLQNHPEALGGKAVAGRRWNNVMKLPVPANAKPFYYYIHVLKDSDGKAAVNLRKDAQPVYSAPLDGAPGQYHWVKIGPVDARALYPDCLVNLSADPKTRIWIDRAVLATDGNLNDEVLNQAE